MRKVDIRKLFGGSGFLVESSEHDTTNIVCARGHIYADGDRLIASLNRGTPAECRSLRGMGTVVMDGDFGELSIAFSPERFRDVARILRPKQASNRGSADSKAPRFAGRNLAIALTGGLSNSSATVLSSRAPDRV